MSTHSAVATTKLGAIGIISVPTVAPKDGEVQIKVDSAALSPFNLYQVDSGFYVSQYPTTLGITGSGTITRVGEGARGFAVGDRVAFAGFDGGPANAFQEFVTVSDTTVGKIPDSLSFEEASTIPDNFITAWFTITDSLGIPLSLISTPSNPSEPIYVFGSGSSSGQFAIQVLKATGFTNIITTASPKHHEYLRELGATHIFDYRSSTLTSDILAVTNGSKIKFVFDCIANESSMKAISGVVEKGSKIAMLLPIKMGNSIVAGELLQSVPQEISPFPDGVEVIGTRTFTYQQNEDLKENLMRNSFASLVADGSIRPNRVRVIDSGTLGERAETAFSLLRSGEADGSRIVLKITGRA